MFIFVINKAGKCQPSSLTATPIQGDQKSEDGISEKRNQEIVKRGKTKSLTLLNKIWISQILPSVLNRVNHFKDR